MLVPILAAILAFSGPVQPSSTPPGPSAPAETPAAPTAAPVEKKMEWTVEGTKREAIVFVPDAATKTQTPVIFAFHGHGGTAKSASRLFDYQKHWPEAITVYMQGQPAPGKTDPDGKRNGWQKAAGELNDRDLKFFDAVLARLKKDYKVDDNRIYATGFSNGGGFTYVLWAARGDVFAAVAPAAGGLRDVLTLKPRPALIIAGDKDTVVPFEMQQRMIDVVRRIDGCDPKGREWARPESGECTAYPSKSGTPVVTYIFPGGHRFPDDAGALVVKFFKEHAKAAVPKGPAPATKP